MASRLPARFVSIAFRAVVCVVLLGGAVAIYLALVATQPTLASGAHEEGGRRVAVFEPRTLPVQRQWSGFGAASAIDDAAVPARVAAVVVERPERIRAGATVAANEVLLRLDDSDFRHQVEIASNTLAELDAQLSRLDIEQAAWRERVRLADEDAELVRLDVERIKDAAQREAAKAREVEAAQQRLIAAERQAVASREELDKVPARRLGLQALRDGAAAQRRLAEQSIERCTVGSPLDGVLASVDVERGESVAPGQRVARVLALDRIEVPLRLPASARGAVAVGDEVTLFDEGRGGRQDLRSWPARIVRIAPDDDPATRTMAVFAEVRQEPDAPGMLAPGRFVEGVATSSRAVPRMVVPRRAVRSDHLFVVSDGRIVRREVTPDFTLRAEFPALGLPDVEWVALREPLPPGDLVVLDASRALLEGAAATPTVVGMPEPALPPVAGAAREGAPAAPVEQRR